MKKRTVPHTYIILFILLFVACLMTYLIPSGEFERVFDEKSAQTLVVAGSYHEVTATPVAPYSVFNKIFEAATLSKTASLAAFILLIGGAFEVIMKTGSLTALCESTLMRMKRFELWFIPIFVCLFSVFGFTMGLTTASIVFVPIGIAAAKALGIPKMCGIAMVALGTNAGFTAGIYNPFSVGIAQMIAEIPIFSGAGLRWVALIVLNVVTSLYLMRYAAKHSVEASVNEETHPKMTVRQKVTIAEFVAAFILLTIGISCFGWGTDGIVVVFLVASIVMGLTSKLSVNEICETFTDGCKKMIKGVIIIVLASTIRLILADGNIMDTITLWLTNGVIHLPSSVQLLGMFLLNALINFLVTSGSAKAALIMPLLTPMADTLGLTRQSAVFAFQMGDGLTNLASPISTTLNGVLAVSEENYGRWFRFYIPLVGIYILTGGLLVLLSRLIGY